MRCSTKSDKNVPDSVCKRQAPIAFEEHDTQCVKQATNCKLQYTILIWLEGDVVVKGAL